MDSDPNIWYQSPRSNLGEASLVADYPILPPQLAHDDPTLPPPWKLVRDGAYGRFYYWNTETNVTQFERPWVPSPFPYPLWSPGPYYHSPVGASFNYTTHYHYPNCYLTPDSHTETVINGFHFPSQFPFPSQTLPNSDQLIHTHSPPMAETTHSEFPLYQPPSAGNPSVPTFQSPAVPTFVPQPQFPDPQTHVEAAANPSSVSPIFDVPGANSVFHPELDVDAISAIIEAFEKCRQSLSVAFREVNITSQGRNGDTRHARDEAHVLNGTTTAVVLPSSTEPHHELASLNLVSSLPECDPSQISPESDRAEVLTVDSSYSSFTPGTNDVDVTDFDLDVTDVDVTDICSKLPDMVEKHGSGLDCIIAKANDSSSATTAMPQETKDVECYKHECEPVYGVCKFGTTRMRVNDIIHPSVDLMIMDNRILNGSIGFLNGNIGEGNLSAGDIYEGNAEELHSAIRGGLKVTNDMMLLSADAQSEVRLCMCCFQFCHGGTTRFLRWHRQAYDTMCAMSHTSTYQVSTTLISNFHNGESAFESSFSVMLAPYFNCLNGDVSSDNWSHAEWLEKMLVDAGNLLLNNMSAGEMHPDSSLIFTGWDTDNSIDVASLGTDMIYMSPNMTELFTYLSLVNVSLPKVFSMAPDEKNRTCICRRLLYWLYLCHCKEKVSTGTLNACLNGDIDCLPRENKMVQVSLFHAHTLEKLILLLADELETIRHQFLLHNSADAMFVSKDGNFLSLKSKLGLVCVVEDKSVELELVEFLKRILSQGLVYLPEEISALTFAKPPPMVTLFVVLKRAFWLCQAALTYVGIYARIFPGGFSYDHEESSGALRRLQYSLLLIYFQYREHMLDHDISYIVLQFFNVLHQANSELSSLSTLQQSLPQTLSLQVMLEVGVVPMFHIRNVYYMLALQGGAPYGVHVEILNYLLVQNDCQIDLVVADKNICASGSFPLPFDEATELYKGMDTSAINQLHSTFLLNWLVHPPHELGRWSAAINLALTSSCLLVIDRKPYCDYIARPFQVLCLSKTTLVKGAGVGLGFSTLMSEEGLIIEFFEKLADKNLEALINTATNLNFNDAANKMIAQILAFSMCMVQSFMGQPECKGSLSSILVDEAMHICDHINNLFGVLLNFHHYGCLVDLVGRAGMHLMRQEYNPACQLTISTSYLPRVQFWGFTPNEAARINFFIAACVEFGDIRSGCQMFDNFSCLTVFSVIEKLFGYHLKFWGARPDQVTWIVTLNSSTSMGNLEETATRHYFGNFVGTQPTTNFCFAKRDWMTIEGQSYSLLGYVDEMDQSSFKYAWVLDRLMAACIKGITSGPTLQKFATTKCYCATVETREMQFKGLMGDTYLGDALGDAVKRQAQLLNDVVQASQAWLLSAHTLSLATSPVPSALLLSIMQVISTIAAALAQFTSGIYRNFYALSSTLTVALTFVHHEIPQYHLLDLCRNSSAGDIYEGNAEELNLAVRGCLKHYHDQGLIFTGIKLEALSANRFDKMEGDATVMIDDYNAKLETRGYGYLLLLAQPRHVMLLKNDDCVAILEGLKYKCIDGDDENWSSVKEEPKFVAIGSGHGFSSVGMHQTGFMLFELGSMKLDLNKEVVLKACDSVNKVMCATESETFLDPERKIGHQYRLCRRVSGLGHYQGALKRGCKCSGLKMEDAALHSNGGQHLDCDLRSLKDTTESVEKVIGWFVTYNSEPVISTESLKNGLVIHGIILADVIPPSCIGVTFDDIKALGIVKNRMKKLVMLSLQRPELFCKSQLTKKGLPLSAQVDSSNGDMLNSNAFLGCLLLGIKLFALLSMDIMVLLQGLSYVT